MINPIEAYSTMSEGQDLTPYEAVQVLLDGALEYTSAAIVAQKENNPAGRGEAVDTTLTIIGLLQDSLDRETGGELAQNLNALYDYMTRRLAHVALDKTSGTLEEVQALVVQIRDAWAQIDPAKEPAAL
ncbi:MAG: flagellar export chaperone FliS [Gammaproteobacteria bacterium]|nr:flagellar export chaperone FliS [Gammaproteobacteria bacterium]